MPNRLTLGQHALLGLLAAAAVTVGVWASSVLLAPAPLPGRADVAGLLWPDPTVLQPFDLAASDGGRFDLARVHGRWTLLTFGFTHCPDVCPTTLLTLRKAVAGLREQGSADGVQVVFVSIDPARDPPERLAQYVTWFDQQFLGASADLEALEALTSQIGVFHQRGEPDANGDYEVAHSALLLMIDPRGRLVGALPPADGDEVAATFGAIREFVNARL